MSIDVSVVLEYCPCMTTELSGEGSAAYVLDGCTIYANVLVRCTSGSIAE